MTDHDFTFELCGAYFKVSYSLTPTCRETGTSNLINSSLRVECTEIEDPDLVAQELLGLPKDPMDPNHGGIKRPDGELFHQGEDFYESVLLAVDAELEREGDLFNRVVEAGW